jgi:hypothetical protein
MVSNFDIDSINFKIKIQIFFFIFRVFFLEKQFFNEILKHNYHIHSNYIIIPKTYQGGGGGLI